MTQTRKDLIQQQQNLARLIAYHESWAELLRVTADLHARHLLPDTVDGIASSALATFDHANGGPPLVTKKRRRARRAPVVSGAKRDSLKARRAANATILAALSRTVPVEGVKIGRGVGPWVRRGYLVAKGDGYVRTAKEYVP